MFEFPVFYPKTPEEVKREIFEVIESGQFKLDPKGGSELEKESAAF